MTGTTALRSSRVSNTKRKWLKSSRSRISSETICASISSALHTDHIHYQPHFTDDHPEHTTTSRQLGTWLDHQWGWSLSARAPIGAKNFKRERLQSCKIFAKRRLDPSSRSATIFTRRLTKPTETNKQSPIGKSKKSTSNCFNQNARNFVCGRGSTPDPIVGRGAHITTTPPPLSEERRERKGRRGGEKGIMGARSHVETCFHVNCKLLHLTQLWRCWPDNKKTSTWQNNPQKFTSGVPGLT